MIIDVPETRRWDNRSSVDAAMKWKRKQLEVSQEQYTNIYWPQNKAASMYRAFQKDFDHFLAP